MQGFEVADDVVAMSGHIKEVGTHSVKLKFDKDLTATVNVVVVPFSAALRRTKAAGAEITEPASSEQSEQEQEPTSESNAEQPKQKGEES